MVLLRGRSQSGIKQGVCTSHYYYYRYYYTDNIIKLFLFYIEIGLLSGVAHTQTYVTYKVIAEGIYLELPNSVS